MAFTDFSRKPSTSTPNHEFQQHYATDPEFRKHVEKQRRTKLDQKTFTKALGLIANKRATHPKTY